MNDIALFICKETKEQREYLTNFFKRMENLKNNGSIIDVYKIGMKENPKFWSELYDDYTLPEEKCKRKYIRLGPEYQVKI